MGLRKRAKGLLIDRARHGAPDRKVVRGPHFTSFPQEIEMLLAHLKRMLKLDRLRARGLNGARDAFILAATAQNLRKMAKLIPARALKPA